MDHYHHLNGNCFVWDSDKARKNLNKHKVSFEEAATVFDDPLFKLVDASDKGETRDGLIGFSATTRLLFVVHIQIEGECIRIISARPTETEEEAYYAD